MRQHLVGITAVVVAVSLLSACGDAISDEHVIDEPATVKEVQAHGTEVALITLEESAAARLGIETVSVAADGKGLIIPSAATFLDTEGTFWVYTNPDPLQYIREPIEVVDEEGESTFASDGPAPGTQVVTVGVPELWGAETGMDH